MRIKTFSELEAEILQLLPDALFTEGKDGEIYIETGLRASEDDHEQLEEI